MEPLYGLETIHCRPLSPVYVLGYMMTIHSSYPNLRTTNLSYVTYH